jgi:putative hydrolase of the HAD superfamily
MIKAILLDLFGTIVAYGDVEQGTQRAWKGIYAVLCELGAQVPYDVFVPTWEKLFATPLATEEDSLETPFLSKMLRLFRHYGLPTDRIMAQRAVDGCLHGWDGHLYLPDDTIPTLQKLRRDYRLALVSNFDHPPYVRALLPRYGLDRLLEPIIISGEIRIDKPDPRIFQKALQSLGCRAEEAIFVGDSLQSDIAGARAVGCRPVLIDIGGQHPGYAGERIRALSELSSLLSDGTSH